MLRKTFYSVLVAAAGLLTWDATVGSTRLPHPSAERSSTAAELQCDLHVGLRMIGQLPEASGLALSRRTPGLVWSMDDSDDPAVLAFSADGTEKAAVRVTGAAVRDWEDISIGPCPDGSCLYVADIGDVGVKRTEVTVYRIPEPGTGEHASPPATTLTFRYPDKGHDAEALFVAPDQTLFIITKGHPTILYRAPRDAKPGTVATLTRVAELPMDTLLVEDNRRRSRVTDAETSPNGKWVAVRTNSELLLFPTDALMKGDTARAWHADVRALDETQGEGVAISDAGDVYLAGEGGGHGLPGTLTHVKCKIPD